MYRFHRSAIDLLPTPPVFSEANARAFAKRERQLRLRLPDSVREWYSFEGSIELLKGIQQLRRTCRDR
jgi:hypothetical protein